METRFSPAIAADILGLDRGGLRSLECFFDARGYVYFLQGGPIGLIKIGNSSNPWDRVLEHQASSPVKLDLLAMVRGGRGLERFIHEALAAHRVRGEWFAPARVVLEVARRLHAHTSPQQLEHIERKVRVLLELEPWQPS